MRNLTTLKRKIVLACKIMYNEGILDAHGHLSARVPGSNSFLITPRIGPGFVKEEDTVTLDLDGQLINGRNPPSEFLLHAAIYQRRTDVLSISHFHSTFAIAIGVVGEVIKPLHGEGRLFAAGVPLYNESLRIRSKEAASRVAKTLADKRAVLLRGHGAIVVGEDVETACIGSIYLENAARMQCLCKLLGHPQPLTKKEANEWVNVERAWDYYVKRLQAGKPSQHYRLI